MAQRHAHAHARRELGTAARAVAVAVRSWVEHDRDTAAAEADLSVHATTVRHRVHRFAELTGIDPQTTFGAIDAWWLSRAWLQEASA